MVSNARLDLPEPDSPVTTISLSRGISSDTFLRLCTRAPCTAIVVRATVRGAGGPDVERFLIIRNSPCAVLCQERCNLFMTSPSRPCQWRRPRRIVDQVRLGAVLQKKFHHGGLAEFGRPTQGRRPDVFIARLQIGSMFN